MLITDYRVQNVLRTYSRQLQRTKLSSRLQEPGQEGRTMPSENVTISEEGRRRLILDHLASQTREHAAGPQDEIGFAPEPVLESTDQA